MGWTLETQEQKKARDAAWVAQKARMIEQAKQQQAADHQAWAAKRCPYCGRDDPLPPWLH